MKGGRGSGGCMQGWRQRRSRGSKVREGVREANKMETNSIHSPVFDAVPLPQLCSRGTEEKIYYYRLHHSKGNISQDTNLQRVDEIYYIPMQNTTNSVVPARHVLIMTKWRLIRRRIATKQLRVEVRD